jgi:hypothetical protein
MEPMSIASTITYGGFANFPGRSRYEIELSISIPDRDRPTHLTFSSDHR